MSDLGDLAVRVTADLSDLDKKLGRVPQIADDAANGFAATFGGVESKLGVVGDNAAGQFADGFATVESDADRAAGKFVDGFGGVESKLGKIGDKAGEELADGVEQQLDKAGPGLAEGAGALGLAVAAAFTTGALESVERSFLSDKLAAQINLDPADQEVAGAIAGSLYAGAWGDSLGQVNDAVGAVVVSLVGLEDAGRVEDLTARALDFAATFDGDVVDAVGNVQSLIASGLAVDAEAAFDLLAAGSQAIAPALRGDLSMALTEYGQFYNAVGIDGPQALALLTAAGNTFELDKAGDAIKEFSVLSTDGSEATGEAFDALGLNAAIMQTSLIKGGGLASRAFEQVVTGLSEMTDPAEQSATALALFGAPLEDLGIQKIPAFIEQLVNAQDGLAGVDGASERMGATLNDNTSTAVEESKRAVEGWFASLVEGDSKFAKIAATATGVGQALAPIGPGVLALGYVFRSQFASGGAAAGRWLAATARASVGAIAHYTRSAASAVASAARSTVAMASQAAFAITYYTSIAASAVASALRAAVAMTASVARQVAGWVLLGAQSLLQAARVAAAWLIAMGPIAIAIALVVGLVALIIKNWDTIVAATKKAFDWVVGKINDVWDFLLGLIKKAVALYVGFYVGAFNLIVGAVRAAFEWIVEKVQAVWSFLLGAIKKAVALYVGFYVGAFNLIKGAIIAFKDAIVSVATSIRDKIVGAFTYMRDLAVGAFTALRDGVSDKITQVLGFVTELPGKIGGKLSGLATLLVNKGKDVVRGLWDGISGMSKWLADKVIGFVKSAIPGPIARALGIASPSKVTAELGRHVAAGLALGLDDKAAAVMSSAASIALGIADELEGAAANADIGSVSLEDAAATLADLSSADLGRVVSRAAARIDMGPRETSVIVELDGRQILRALGEPMAETIRVRGGVRR
jgi:hypothetical protein